MDAALDELRRDLARPDLALTDLFAAGQRIRAQAAAWQGAPDKPTTRIAVLGGLTLDYLGAAIGCAAVQEGMAPILSLAPYGTWIQEVLDPQSGLHRFRPDVVVFAIDRRDVMEALRPDAGEAAVAEAVAAKCALFQRLWGLLHSDLGARALQHTLVPPAEGFRGPAERVLPASPVNHVRALDGALRAAGRDVHWIELDRLAAEIGSRAFAGERFFHAAKLGFDPQFLPDYLPFFRAAWRSAHGRVRKVLALDLDNTLWGGVIGDDGIDGIRLGPGSAEGEAFAAWGAYLHGLRARGVILAACSKNDPAIAGAAFAHAHSVLKREDFAAFECSWEDKVRGLRRVARALNLDLDAIVFADDNPAECAIVREHLPEVAVVELGDDPACFVALLEQGHWFDLPAYTAEDFARNATYAARAAAAEAAAGATDVDTYLAGLRMVGRLGPPAPADMARLVQLEQKTNQFNLTTRRHSAAALADFVHREDAMVLALRLADRFGDHGLVSSLIALAEGNALRIESWLMSCRVFSRGAEALMLRRLLAEARARGLSRLVGEYRATAKNGVVADLYARLGFVPVDDAGVFWERPAAEVRGELAHFIADADAAARVAAE